MMKIVIPCGILSLKVFSSTSDLTVISMWDWRF